MQWSCGLCLCLCLLGVARGANILVVVPTLSSSHYVMFRALIEELLRRGHHVTSIITFPQDNPPANLTEINVRPVRFVLENNFSFDHLSEVPAPFLSVIPNLFDYIDSTESVLNATDVLQLIGSNRKFDLIINEMFVDDVFLGFAHKFGAPVVTLSTCYMFPWVPDRFGIPANPSHVPGFFGGYTRNMDLYQRALNTFLSTAGKLFYYYWLEPYSTVIVRKYFGSDAPPTRVLARNISLYLTNTHFTFFGSQSFPPQVVDISGIQLKPAKTLPKDLDRWMNESTHGVVYFSFGSMLRGATLPVDKVQAFLQVFKLLPQKILWKWEDDAFDGLPNNVKVMKWLPQRDILAHSNVKAFISHGGLMGTTEAVVSGVPILGIPMYGDQPNNVAALVENGVAVHVDYNNISVASLSYALNALLNDKSYRENAAQLARRFLDRPMSPLDTAVYWTEYVIRHGGAPHLRSAAVSLDWYQYYLLDVVVVCLAALLAFIAAIYYSLHTFLRILCTAKITKLKSN